MSTTVTNSNPIIISGGTMASGARATIYPGQITRSFKVMKVMFVAGANNDTFTITDNSSAANVLITGSVGSGAPAVVNFDFPTGVTWADWKVTTLTNATSDKVLVYLK